MRYWREIQCVVSLLYVFVLLTTELIYTQNVLEMFFITNCLDAEDEILKTAIKEKK